MNFQFLWTRKRVSRCRCGAVFMFSQNLIIVKCKFGSSRLIVLKFISSKESTLGIENPSSRGPSNCAGIYLNWSDWLDCPTKTLCNSVKLTKVFLSRRDSPWSIKWKMEHYRKLRCHGRYFPTAVSLATAHWPLPLDWQLYIAQV